VLSGRGVCDGLITRTEESCRVCACVRARARVCVCVCECDCQASIMKTHWPKGDVAPLGKIANGDPFRNLLELNLRKAIVYLSVSLTHCCQDHRGVSDA
jgi:hypothetical protein